MPVCGRFARTANNSLFPPDVQISRLKIVHDAIVRSLCNRSVAGVGKLEEMHCLPPGKETLRRLIVNPGCDSSDLFSALISYLRVETRQAKSRMEHTHLRPEDSLIKDLILNGISKIDAANAFANKYMGFIFRIGEINYMYKYVFLC